MIMMWRNADGTPKGVNVNDPKFRCCGCCHVQTATICLGVYNFMTQVVCLSVLMLAVLHPNLLDDAAKHYSSYGDDMLSRSNDDFFVALGDSSRAKHVIGELTPLDQLEPLPTPLPLKLNGGSDDVPVPFAKNKDDVYMTTKRWIQSGNLNLAVAFVFGMLVITALLVYGSTKGRPVYLLPFFCFQVFDFILACFTAVGRYTYLPNIHEIIVNNSNVPYRSVLLRLNSEWIALSVMIIYILVLFLKAYLIGIVWSCYQYLQLKNGRMLVRDSPDAEQLLLPPDYNDATKMTQAKFIPPPIYEQPPPGYSSN